MNYKNLFGRTIALLSSPGKAWEDIAGNKEGRLVISGFVYPMIGLCGLSEFLGAFIGKGFTPDIFQLALTRCCAIAVALFGGFFLSAYLLEKAGKKWFGCKNTHEEVMVFVGYSMVMKFILSIIGGLFSVVLLEWLLQFYTIVIVFEGARRLIRVDDGKLTAYTLVATAVVLCCPFLIEFVFNELSVILN